MSIGRPQQLAHVADAAVRDLAGAAAPGAADATTVTGAGAAVPGAAGGSAGESVAFGATAGIARDCIVVSEHALVYFGARGAARALVMPALLRMCRSVRLGSRQLKLEFGIYRLT